MATKPRAGISPVFVAGLHPGTLTPLPGIRRLIDGEDFSALLHLLTRMGHDRHRGMTDRDAEPAMLAFLRSAIAAYEWHGRWEARDATFVPIADSSAPLLPLAAFCKDGTMHVGPPETIAAMRTSAARSSQVDHIARLLSRHNATMTFMAMDDRPDRYSVLIQVDGVDRDFVSMLAAVERRDEDEVFEGEPNR